MENLKVPARFGGVKPIKPHIAKCRACDDFGSILLADSQREPRTVPQMMRHEAPCTCAAGDLARQLFAEFSSPLPTAKASLPGPRKATSDRMPQVQPLARLDARKLLEGLR